MTKTNQEPRWTVPVDIMNPKDGRRPLELVDIINLDAKLTDEDPQDVIGTFVTAVVDLMILCGAFSKEAEELCPEDPRWVRMVTLQDRAMKQHIGEELEPALAEAVELFRPAVWSETVRLGEFLRGRTAA